jgi:TPR repeat protein
MTIKKQFFALVLILSYSIFSSAEASDISLLIKECDEGRANSCGQAGVYYENSENADLKKAEQMYSAGCDLDDMFSCGALIYLPDDKDSFNKINKLQTDIHKNTSATNNSFNSLDETIASFNHRNLSTNLKKIFSTFNDYCAQGEGKACLYSGVMNNYGLGTKRNLKKAISNYESACDSNISKACYNLGFMYEYGKGIKQNKGTAAKYFEKGCDLNVGQACRNRAWLYVKGKGKYHDPNMAFSYFFKGCELNDVKSCSSVGYSYLHGSGTKKDLEMARKYYKIACTRGHKKSCSFK